MTQQERDNRQKFLSPPTIQQIESVVKKLNVSEKQFERYYGIPKGVIAQIRFGNRSLPAKFWHLILEEQPHQSVIKRPITKLGATTITNSITKSKNRLSKDGTITSLFS